MKEIINDNKLLLNKQRFINEVQLNFKQINNNSISIYNKNKEAINQLLKENNYIKYTEIYRDKLKYINIQSSQRDYDYLLNIPFYDLSQDKMKRVYNCIILAVR